ncbi:hypothetical protein CFP56_038397, partial [Quercus suber]
MVSVSLFVFFALSHLSLLHSVEEEKRKQPNCSPFLCRKFGIIDFPFTNSADPNCSLLPLCHYKRLLHLQSNSNTTQSMRIKDFLLSDYLTSQKCEFLTKTRITHSNDSSPSFPSECSIIRVPAVKEHSDDLNLTAEFDLEVH